MHSSFFCGQGRLKGARLRVADRHTFSQVSVGGLRFSFNMSDFIHTCFSCADFQICDF